MAEDEGEEFDEAHDTADVAHHINQRLMLARQFNAFLGLNTQRHVDS